MPLKRHSGSVFLAARRQSRVRNKIFGAIGAVWGGSIVLNWLFSDRPVNVNANYQDGLDAAVIFGFLMTLAGIYYFFKRPD